MQHIVIVTEDRSKFGAFSEVLGADPSYRLDWVDSVKAVLMRVLDSETNLVIVDEEVDQMPNLDIVRKVIMANAMVNLAAVSSLDDEAFHAAAEGLGIIYKIPPLPQKRHVVAVLEALDRIAALS